MNDLHNDDFGLYGSQEINQFTKNFNKINNLF